MGQRDRQMKTGGTYPMLDIDHDRRQRRGAFARQTIDVIGFDLTIKTLDAGFKLTR